MKKVFLLLTILSFTCFRGVSDDFDYSTPEQCMANNYVEAWGRLKLVGNQLSSEAGDPVQLRGWSSHGFQWTGQFYNSKEDFEAMKAHGANIFRVALYIQETGWQNKVWVQNCIDWTAELGMYCLFDWHTLTPGNPFQYLKKQNEEDLVGGKLKDGKGDPVDAEAFFDWVTSYVAEKGYKHVLYEICNEPNKNYSATNSNVAGETQWADVKKYAAVVLPIIAANDPEAIVIVGTASWSQRLDLVSSFPIEDDFGLQLMYTFHFYAGTHRNLIPSLKTATAKIPVFISEWGTTTSDGHGSVYLDYASQFMKVANGDNDGEVLLSWCNWSWSNDSGSGSCRNPSDYAEVNFTPSGKYIVAMLRAGGIPPEIEEGESTPYEETPQTISDEEVSYIWLERYDEGGDGVAYLDNNPSWEGTVSGCNAGNFRPDECIDVFKMTEPELQKIDENEQDKFYNIGYVDNGEWVKYTVDVKKAGFYDVIPFCNAFASRPAENGISFSIDGKNILRRKSDLSGTIATVRYEPSVKNWDDKNSGYNSYDWTYLHKNDEIYGLYFEKEGIQTIKVSFTSGSGLGPLKLMYDATASTDDISASLSDIYPNPSLNGKFSVVYNELSTAVLSIKNLSGQAVFNTEIISGTNEINANLSSGIYLVTLKSGNGIKTQKLIVR